MFFKVYLADDIDGFGYITQDPWIQHMTIRDNILFGKPFYQKEYSEVIKCCALQEVRLCLKVITKMVWTFNSGGKPLIPANIL